jgi:ribosome biogenesis protein Tsr3
MDWHSFLIEQPNSAPNGRANPLYYGTELEQLASISAADAVLYIAAIAEVIWTSMHSSLRCGSDAIDAKRNWLAWAAGRRQE